MARPPLPVGHRLEVRRAVDANGCWNWTGFVGINGYGQIRVNGKINSVHRVAYEHFVAPIPEGLVIDHLCRNRSCFNPEHLEPVSNAVNVMRGEGLAVINARKTHCKRGHEFTPENTRIEPTGRRCKACQAALQRDYDLNRRPGRKAAS